MTISRTTLYFFCLGFSLVSCGGYRQHIMFKVPDGYQVKQEIRGAEANYTIQKNDLLQLEVYTNLGEKIVDPNQESFKSGISTTDQVTRKYLVDINGMVKFPLIEALKMEGLTMRQAEEILQEQYAKFYQQPFVLLTYANKRVVVLGAPGGQVIPLTNENMKLTEVLALAKGITNDAKAYNIRVMRGNDLLVADLSTYAGYQKSNLIMQPDDIVYVEPVRRVFSEALRDYSPIISIVTSLTTLLVVLVRLN